MTNDNTKKQEPALKEQAGISITSTVKIYDPNTKEIYLHVRGDK